MLLICGLAPVLQKNEAYADFHEKYDSRVGGGYAVTGQIKDVSYTCEVYDASNGLPTSDSMCICGTKNGYVWIGGYAGIIVHDGRDFLRLDTAGGLTSARGFYEDSKERLWVATNDNGVVVLDKDTRIHYTYQDGLPSSSIRVFTEDAEGNVFIGTTAGVCYVSPDLALHNLNSLYLDEERILRLDTGKDGKVYGQTSGGTIFQIEHCEITKIYDSKSLGLDTISTIMADPAINGNVYIGTDGGHLYYGNFGAGIKTLEEIKMPEFGSIHWINYDCNRVWVSSPKHIGYLDENKEFHMIYDIPFDSSIEMMTADYQGNIWVASSSQGAMKIVANNFVDLTKKVGSEEEIVNATCLYHGYLYVGTDSGLSIFDPNEKLIRNSLTSYLKGARIRDIIVDNEDRLWIGTFNMDLGLVCVYPDGQIKNYTTDDGLRSNQIRCMTLSKDGSILVGSNGGFTEISGSRIVRNVGAAEGVKNTVFLTVCEGPDGKIYAGSDGDGVYVIEGRDAYRVGRDEGLTSEVIMRIKKDPTRDIYWIITSNSIQYLENGELNEVTSFPYNNNYDICFDDNGNSWILSSYGIYVIDTEDLVNDRVANYRLHTMANGLPCAIRSNSYSCMDEEGNLYICGRTGVIKVSTKNYFAENSNIKAALSVIYCDDQKIIENADGSYTIPSSGKRIQIVASVLDYTLSNPLIRVYLEGSGDPGVTTYKSDFVPLEYTKLDYGKYDLHIQILGNDKNTVLVDEVYKVVKRPRLGELKFFRVLIVTMFAFAAGFIVWRVMRSTVIRKQYLEIRNAKDEAERANTAKTRFLANMSHEIRTPINTIMGMNEMIMREDATDVPKSYFLSIMNYSFDIQNASDALLSLINDLLDMSKIESGKMHLVNQEYDVSEMLKQIVSMIRVRSTQKELMFDVVIDEMLPKTLYGDVGKIKQVVLNLLTNAVKYTSVGGFALTVSMDARKDDICDIRFSVKDTGMGIKEEDMDKLFNAYERLDEEKNSGIQGTGLGLDISRQFAELMGGKLWCESVYGEGSEFILTLSQKIVDATPMGIFVETQNNSAKGPYVPKFVAPDADVLVVDDTPMNLSVIKGLLKATKVFVTTAASGEEALDKIKENRFNVVLLDHMMPGMDGVETLERIKAISPDLPVYALTANTALGEEFYKEKGFVGFLAKPVDSAALEMAIMKHIPEEMMLKPDAADAEEELTELPENLKWLYEEESINVEEGITNSGGVSNYIFSLQLFLDTLDKNSSVICDAYETDNIRLYTIKVHALKSSARIIGADKLSKMAADMEEAGNKNDRDYITLNHDDLIKEYASYKDILAGINGDTASDENKEPIPEADLREAYEALKDVIPQMDYDSVEMIVNGLNEYRLPEEDAKRISELTTLLKNFDWDGMEQLIENL